MPAFAAAAVWAVIASEFSLPLLLIVVVAIVATVVLTVITGDPKKSAAVRRGAE
ncbi:hypothetical protein Rhow_000864 [Rhodococcus wratislaviensis]|uniref:Uncharacterized protein n=1 Tax=Rhodococcus wratislaviensis TaxID=44752 RepID=A0A402C2W5_RHOWR|nr:hypothetical protein Rhow_000864 [Rhodococcus wratislaviensis]